MSSDDHLALLGTAYHVPKQGASIGQIAEVVVEAGGVASHDALLASLERLIAAGHVERRGDLYRATSEVVDWFGRTHRCYSGIKADAENLLEYLEARTPRS